MNANRRKEIAKIVTELEELKSRLETVLEEEQEYYDNVPENLQNSERYQESEEYISYMEDAVSEFDSIIDALSNI